MNGLKNKIPVDLLLTNGQFINVFSSEIYPADVAIHRDRIVGIGQEFKAKKVIDLNGQYICPAFIDSHLHIESTMLNPLELARALVPTGTTAVVADPHGISNVLGKKGIEYLLSAGKNLPLDIFIAEDERAIGSDHESVELLEAKEKLRLGKQIMVREGSSAKNLEAIYPLINTANSRFFCFCADDISPTDLAKGYINRILQKAVSLKMDPIIAIQMATINPARYFNLKGYGAIAPGYYADLLVLSDLQEFDVEKVFKRGKLVAEKGVPKFEAAPKKKAGIKDTVHLKPLEIETLGIKARSDYAKVIGLVPDQVLTQKLALPVKIKDGYVVSDVKNDVLKLAVIERQKAKRNIGLGLVKGFGLKKGAIATSVTHGLPDVICVGCEDEDMISAIRQVVKMEGGMVVVRGGLVLAKVPLPIAGLMSEAPLETLLEELKKTEKALKDIGCEVEHAFGALSFLTLPTVPELKLTDKGLFDVKLGKIVDLFD